MHIKPYLGEEIGRGKSGFAVNWDAVNWGFTVRENPAYNLKICCLYLTARVKLILYLDI